GLRRRQHDRGHPGPSRLAPGPRDRAPLPARAARQASSSAVTSRTSCKHPPARYPNHIWLADITHVKGLFGLACFRVAAVLDAFSRMPLAVRVFPSEPQADDLAALVLSAA